MVSGFDRIEHEKRVRDHWIRRAVALFIDLLVALVINEAMLFILKPDNVFYIRGIFLGVILFIYSVLLEGTMGFTVGKKVMGLKVRSLFGELKCSKVMMRNLPKLFWFVLLPIDLAAGLAGKGDVRQRYTDRAYKTTVIEIPHEHHKKPPGPDKEPNEKKEKTPNKKKQKAPKEKKEKRSGKMRVEEEPVHVETCVHCGATLNELADGTRQCTKCGEIQ